MTWLKRLCGVKILLIAAFLLAACTPEFEEWNDAAPPVAKKSTVEWSVANHELRFTPDSRWLAPGELSRLDAFLTDIDIRRPVHVYVQTGGTGVSKTLSDSRTATMHALLRARGVMARERPPEMAMGETPNVGGDNPDTAALLIGHYVVSTPGCPDLSTLMIGSYSNEQSSNLGCANQINLGLMVADPRDLVRGRNEGMARSEREIRTIAGYREGILPALPEQGSSSLSGGE